LADRWSSRQDDGVTDLSFTPDPEVFDRALDELGWVGRSAEDPAIVELRDHLAARNGIFGLEVLAPDEIERAVRIFYRDGFVVVRDVLDDDQLEVMRAGCDRVIHEITALDKDRVGNRGSHRYSFGSGSVTGQQLHQPEWQMLIDLPRVTPIVTAIFSSPNYVLRGGGGDFCLPGASIYQPLHSDMGDRREHHGAIRGSFHDPRGMLTTRDLPCPYVCCNFLMVDFTKLNGPTRQIPGSQHSRERPPSLDEEPEWMKLSTVCPAPAGSVLIRDVRAWHGGTPNLSDHVRAIPNMEYFAPWFREPTQPFMSHSDYGRLSDHAQQVARFVTADSSDDLITGPQVGPTPRGLETPLVTKLG
jgi:ectoine hydroxylase-related dioxygenase (phytanoyl-CoA dioxygenase family)